MYFEESPTFNDAFEVYKEYMALKFHFDKGNSYDYFKYNGKTRANKESFVKQSRLFVALYRKFNESIDDCRSYILWCVTQKLKVPYISILLDNENTNLYKEYRKNSIVYNFNLDIKKFNSIQNIKSLLKDFDFETDIPPIIKKYIDKEITFDTLVILNYFFKYTDFYSKNNVENFYYLDFEYIIRQYQNFIDKEIYDECKLLIKSL